ncbi:MAG: LPXTG cell wall anchor domain-containing protein [Clostridia bacterium]|nr:LPXTG cell wall anchor domain-containing protein [Clostridia bacterium]
MKNAIEKDAAIHGPVLRRTALLAVMAIVTAGAVFWMLRIKGITMTNEAGCGLEEHVHTEECIASKTPICGMEESEAHRHGDECCEIVYGCGKTEHVHTASCYPDPGADVETEDDWLRTLPDADLMTGVWNEDIARVAASQLGYEESTENYVLGEDGGRRGYTRYGEWYGNPYGDWSTMFAAFCLNYGGVPADAIPLNSGANAMRAACEAASCFEKRGYTPSVGDLVMLDRSGSSRADSVAVVTAVVRDGSRGGFSIKMIEGDVENAVRETGCALSDKSITGFVSVAKAYEKALSEGSAEAVRNTEEPEPAGTMADPAEETPGATPAVPPEENAGEPEDGGALTVIREGEAAVLLPHAQTLRQLAGGEDVYRLTADISGEYTPTDLLIVLDDASAECAGYLRGFVSSVLEGEDGFIQRFLESDAENTVSVVLLGGDDGAEILFDWGRRAGSIELPQSVSGGSERGLGTIEDMLKAAGSGKSRRAVLIVGGDASGSSSAQAGLMTASRGVRAEDGVVSVSLPCGEDVMDELTARFAAPRPAEEIVFRFGLNGTAVFGGETGLSVVRVSPDGTEEEIPVSEDGAELIEEDNAFVIKLSEGLARGERIAVSFDIDAGARTEGEEDLRSGAEESFEPVVSTVGYRLGGRSYVAEYAAPEVVLNGEGTQEAGSPEPEQHRENGTVSLVVNKVWSDLWAQHEPVTVTLLRKNGDGTITSTGRTVTLGEDNGWQAEFDGLEAPADGEEFAYSVLETVPEDYLVQYGMVTARTNGAWVPAEGNAPEDGKQYVFCTNNGNYLINAGPNSITPYQITPGGSISIGGSTYAKHIASCPDTAVFTAEASGNGFLLKDPTGKYLNGTSLSSTGSVFTVDQQGRLRCPSGYIQLYPGSYWQSPGFGMNTNSGAAFTVYEYVTEDRFETTIKNTKMYPQQGDLEVNPEISKVIDYLGDGAENPDTDLTGSDLYRLYLDVLGSHQPVDLLIVSDITSSMEGGFDSGKTRQQALDEIVNGTILSGSGSGAVRDNDGIVYNFMNMHPENKVAVIGFSGGWNEIGQSYSSTKELHLPILRDWSGREQFGYSDDPTDYSTSLQRQPGQSGFGTNFVAALMRAQEMLESEEIQNDGHIKVMVFLTDGEPNRYINSNGVIAAEGNAPYTNTRNFFIDFLDTHPNLVSYIVGISPEANSGSAYTLLSGIANEGECIYYPANTVQQLHAALKTIIDRSKFSLVEMTDELSAYVEVYEEQPDFKVERIDRFGGRTVIWEGGAPTADNNDGPPDYIPILSGVEYEPSDSGDSTGRVRMIFNPDCMLDGDNRFILSYNVRLTDYAKEQYLEGGYGGSAGEEGTDYPGNDTSSGKPGFPSNREAKLTFTTYDKGYEIPYPHPVVQIPTVTVVIRKTNGSGALLEGAGFDIYLSADESDEGAVLIPGTENVYGVRQNASPIVTGANGRSPEFELFPGDYYLVETNAPAGYGLPDKPVGFTVNDDGSVTLMEGEGFSDMAEIGADGSIGLVILDVVNAEAYELPHTGGSGTKAIAAAGAAIMLAAAAGIGFICRKRSGKTGGTAAVNRI